MFQSKKNVYTIGFIVVLSFGCALVLSILASILKQPQETAKELDRSKQMLMATQILHHNEYFQVRDEEGHYRPAKHIGKGLLSIGSKNDIAKGSDVLAVYKKRIAALLIDQNGKKTTFKEQNLNEAEYTAKHKKTGYANLPLKLIYEIKTNDEKQQQTEGYVVPVSGVGLWDNIYGYLALESDGDQVIGTSWYDHKETPGLGAIIAEPSWTKLFPGKKIFLKKADPKTAPLGITVVRGKVKETLGKGPRAHSAVDGISGATLTGNGVTKAYKDTLTPYRPFLRKLKAQKRERTRKRGRR